MSTGKKLVYAVFVAVMGLCLVSAAGAADTIKVGIILPLTGEQAKFGEIEKRSFHSRR